MIIGTIANGHPYPRPRVVSTALKLSYHIFSVQSDSSDTAVLAVLPLEESPLYALAEENPKVYVSSRETVCGWSPRRQWLDKPLASGAPHRPPSLSEKLLKNYKEHGAILKELDLDPSVKDLSVNEEIPIEKGSRFCPTCEKNFTSHYVAKLHYKFQHLHKTKWGCAYCNSFLTSQHNLDLHMQTVHVDQNYACFLYNAVLPVAKRVFFKTHGDILTHIGWYKRYNKSLQEWIGMLFLPADFSRHYST